MKKTDLFPLCASLALLYASFGNPSQVILRISAAILIATLWFSLHVAEKNGAYSAGSGRMGAILWLGFAILCLASTPILSDDYHRYLWEGFIQNQGYSPFRDPPQALFDQLSHPSKALLNHPELPSIYPPFAQILFRVCALFGQSLWPWKVFLALATIATAWFNRSWRWICFSPIVLIEGFWHAHLDLLGFLLGICLIQQLRAGNALGVGFALGLMGALKWVPLFLAPLLLLHLPAALAHKTDTPALRIRAQFLLGCALGFFPWFLPYLQDGAALWQSLLTFANHWSFNNLFFELLLKMTTADTARFCLALSAALGFLALLFHPKPKLEWRLRAAWILLILTSPTLYPWYFLWLLPFCSPDRLTLFHWVYAASVCSYGVLPAYWARKEWHLSTSVLVFEWLLLLPLLAYMLVGKASAAQPNQAQMRGQLEGSH